MRDMVAAIPDPEYPTYMLEQCLQMDWTNVGLTQDCQGLKIIYKP